VSLLLAVIIVPLYATTAMPHEVRLTEQEFASTSPIYIPYSRLFKQRTNFDSMVGEEDEKYIDIKLFGFLPVRRIKVENLVYEELYAGGQLVGFVAEIEGVLVAKDAPEYKLKKGDLVRRVGGNDIFSVKDFEGIVSQTKSGTIEVEILRGGSAVVVNVPAGDSLGLWLKDETSGIGTLTYVVPGNNNFGALGHRLNDFETSTSVNVRGGGVYSTSILGINKSQGKKVGAFRALIKQGNNMSVRDVASLGDKKGDITGSSFSGVYGCFYDGMIEGNSRLPVSSRYNVRPGAAKLRTQICNEGVREFDIEIIKTRFQKNPNTKSMIVRVTDKELLEKTGGIVHGMSGSPIIQDGKIVGALTHVVMGDPSRGYGIYIDFMLN